jgi:hypothetical protein
MGLDLQVLRIALCRIRTYGFNRQGLGSGTRTTDFKMRKPFIGRPLGYWKVIYSCGLLSPRPKSSMLLTSASLSDFHPYGTAPKPSPLRGPKFQRTGFRVHEVRLPCQFWKRLAKIIDAPDFCPLNRHSPMRSGTRPITPKAIVFYFRIWTRI